MKTSNHGRRKPRASLSRPSFKYRNRYGLIVEQPSERAQRREFNRLKRMGFRPKVVVV